MTNAKTQRTGAPGVREKLRFRWNAEVFYCKLRGPAHSSYLSVPRPIAKAMELQKGQNFAVTQTDERTIVYQLTGQEQIKFPRGGR